MAEPTQSGQGSERANFAGRSEQPVSKKVKRLCNHTTIVRGYQQQAESDRARLALRTPGITRHAPHPT